MRKIILILCALSIIACKEKKSNNKLLLADSTTRDIISYDHGELVEISPDNIPIIDLNKKYPEQEIILQDIASIEYIPLETRDDILVQGNYLAYYSNKSSVVYNPEQGDIFIFDSKTGKLISKFNGKGRSGNEYINIFGLAYDENLEEIYVADNRVSSTIILIYSKEGKFIRAISMPQGVYIDKISNFDNETLLIYNRYRPTLSIMTDINQQKPYLFISKKNGSIVSRIDINFSERLSDRVYVPVDKGAYPMVISMWSNIKYSDEYVIADLSSDTVFVYTKEKGAIPLFTRTPSVWDNEGAFLGMSVGLKTDRLVGINAVIFDFATLRKEFEKGNQPTLDNIELLYDFKSNTVFKKKIVNSDSSTGFNRLDSYNVDIQERNTSVSLISSIKIIEALERNELKGELLSIAQSIDEGDNPVLMIIRFK